jgi:flavin-dependent dehydrogenase
VIIVGGALSGSSTACLLLRRNPRLRVLIVERDPAFKRRVGESTVEVSAWFLARQLDLAGHLLEKHLPKQGLRFWFHNERAKTLAGCSETGPGYNVRFPGYQVDRAVLDEEVLARAVAAGATLLRPAKVRSITLAPGGLQTLELENTSPAGAAGPTTLRARWVVDASGFAALLARREGWLQPNTAHPTAAVWTRWSGVKNWDSRDLADRFPGYARRTKALRHVATNHLVGLGWWAWVIPLRGGDVSVGVVFDQRLVELPEGEHLGERLRALLLTHPAGREILAEATWHRGDVHFRRNLAYRSTTFAGDGFALVGDASAFIDPFYSPGMDWIAYTAGATAALLDACLRGQPAAPRVARHNTHFSLAYDRWFEGVYRDKYYYMGDHQLMTTAFRLDLGLYYFGVVARIFKLGPAALETPPFANPGAGPFARLIAFYNRRLAALARGRLARGVWGARNHAHVYSFRSYELTWTLPLRLLVAFGAYARLELLEGWHTWFAAAEAEAEAPRTALPARRPSPSPAPAT